MSSPIASPLSSLAADRFLRPATARGLLVATIAAALASGAFAQNALSGPYGRNDGLRRYTGGQNLPLGRGLDASLRVGSGGFNDVGTNANPDFYGRNLIVTNSVAGGRGFRGSVGYTADTDFRGRLGSDDTYLFRAGSALSAAPFATSSLSLDRFNIAQNMGVFEYRREFTPLSAPQLPGSLPDSRLRLDRANAAMSTGRLYDQSIEPSQFAVGNDRDNRQIAYTVSGVQGLRTQRMDDPIDGADVSVYEKARARREVREGMLTAESALAPFVGELSYSDSLTQPSDVQPRLDTQIDPESAKVSGTSATYEEIVRRVVERYADNPNVHVDADPQVVEKVREDLARVRGAIDGRIEPTRTTRPAPASTTSPSGDDSSAGSSLPSANPGLNLSGDPALDPGAIPSLEPDGQPGTDRTAIPPSLTDPGLPANLLPGANTNPDPTASLTPEQQAAKELDQLRESIAEAARALRHGVTVRDLTPGERARVDELVRDGQRALETGEFFRAERCFDQALSINPGNPLLTAGLANSQLGAGLYLSAALSLRDLFSQHPEMIDVRYEARLLPSETRLRLALRSLRERIAAGKDADGYGMVLAFIGHQMADRALVAEGLKSVQGNREQENLRELLTGIWLDDGRSVAPSPSGESGAPSPVSEPAP